MARHVPVYRPARGCSACCCRFWRFRTTRRCQFPPAAPKRAARAEATAERRAAAGDHRAPRPAARAPACRHPPPPARPRRALGACARAITAAEQGSGLPAGAAVRHRPGGDRPPVPPAALQPWPWSYNAAGEGPLCRQPRGSDRRRAGAARLRHAFHRHRLLCDHLLHHPDAFPSVEAGFDPDANARYAVRSWRSLYARTGDWAQATAQYHSATPERGLIYHHGG